MDTLRAEAVRDRAQAAICHGFAAFQPFRRVDWMPEPPCARRAPGFACCGSQRSLRSDNAASTHPVCELFEQHQITAALAAKELGRRLARLTHWRLRGIRAGRPAIFKEFP